MSFAKLFSSITESSLWSESKETRLMFVTMLAKADQVGFVEAAVPGLARAANLTVEEAQNALEVLESPDPHSKDLEDFPDNEGRRITRVPGGWIVINYEEYRSRRGDDERREYMREYMREYRKKRKHGVNSSKQQLATVSPSRSRSRDRGDIARSARSSICDAAEEVYRAYPIKKGKKPALKAIEKSLQAGATKEAMLSAVEAFAEAHRKGAPAPHASTYFNQERWQDEDNGTVSDLIPEKNGAQKVTRSVPEEKFRKLDI